MHGWQRRARAQAATLERGDGAAEMQARFDLCALQKPVEEARMEGVACARRVATTAGDGAGGRFDEDALVIDQRAAYAARQARHGATVARFHFDERRAFVCNAGQAHGELTRRDELVNERE